MKISIVTPCLNVEEFISQTIESIISQTGKFEIEYIIMDGNSTDKTVEIANEYKKKVDLKQYPIQCSGVEIYVYSEDDQGMYSALNKGFRRATGEIFAYLNADDIYLPNSLAQVISLFEKYSEVFWLKGITSYINSRGNLLSHGKFNMYTQEWIQLGRYGKEYYFITQDSVFWRSSVWKKCGGFNALLKYAGDYDLWMKFSHYHPLYLTNLYISCFRRREGQLSKDHNYKIEMLSISGKKNIFISYLRKIIKLFPGFAKNHIAARIYKDRFFYLVINHDKKNSSIIKATAKDIIKTKLPVIFF